MGLPTGSQARNNSQKSAFWADFCYSEELMVLFIQDCRRGGADIAGFFQLIIFLIFPHGR